MNKIYKVIWSKVRNCYVAVSEIAKRNGKSCTSVNCGAKVNRTRSLRMTAVTLGVMAALVGGLGSSVAFAEDVVTVSNAQDPTGSASPAGAISYFTDDWGDKTYYISDSTIKSLKITGGNGENYDFAAGYSNGTDTVTGYTLTVSGGTLDYVFGGQSRGDTTGNTVIFSGVTAVGIYGGFARTQDGAANDNKVTINQDTNVTTKVGDIYGGRGQGGATGNTVTITGGQAGSIIGGEGGDANNNSVLISGNNTIITGNVYGGQGYSATGNNVEIKGGTGYQMVVGGFVFQYGEGPASNNKVTVENITVSGDIYGATDASNASSSNSNVVTVNNSTVNNVYGGHVKYGRGTASNNVVEIKGGKVNGENIIGGYAAYGNADGNIVTISGSPELPLSGICGGYTSGSGASNNIINILSPLTARGLTGGLSSSTGNTLNVAAKNVTTSYVEGFQNMNFYLPADIAKDDTMLTVNTNVPTDVKGVTFGVAALSGVNLQKGDTVNLLVNSNGLTMDDTLKTTDSATLAKASFLSANSLTTDNKYELSISKKGEDTIIATVDNVTEQSVDAGGDTSGDTNGTTSAVEEIKKSPVETRMGVVTMVNAGADLLAGQGMANAADAAAAERSGGDGVAAARAGGFAPFAAVGLGNLRAKSGSHVDTKSIGLSLGFAREIENKSGKLLVGPVVEYGHGKYDSYQDNGITADGKSSYWGIGVIAKQTNHNGFYYEGSLRAGRTKSDYGSDSARPGNHVSYDSSATYWAAHLGAGKLFDIGHDNTLDVYGKYFYSHTGGDSTTIHIGAASEGVDFSAVNSHRLRIGTRLTHALNAKNKIYGGLAWQYEFNGDARAVYSVSGEAPSPSVKGSSGMLELGWQVKPGKSPMTIDLGVTGWVGKLRGVAANVQMNWTF